MNMTFTYQLLNVVSVHRNSPLVAAWKDICLWYLFGLWNNEAEVFAFISLFLASFNSNLY